jgi:Leucine-rich repeat (LRR) protein
MKITTQSQVFALIILSVIEVSISWLNDDSDSVPVCEINDTYVDCRNKNLTEVPKLPNLPETVTHLDFSFNNIRTVSLIDVPFPLSIVDISFSHNIIDTVMNGVFGNTTNLLHLDLSYNKIKGSVLHTEPFYLDIGQLRKLNLRGNDLETIDDETFSPFGISNIEYLDISHCSLKSLGYSIHNLGSLSFLNLSYNLLTKFEDSLTGDINLETLDISFNKIITVKKVPAVLSLKYLYLDYNELEAARDNAFQSLLGLKVLSLVGNNLKTLHPHTLPLDSLFIELQEIRLDKNPWRCDCNMKWLLKDVTDVSGFRNFTLK